MALHRVAVGLLVVAAMLGVAGCAAEPPGPSPTTTAPVSPSPTPSPTLSGPAVYVGDELDWFLPDQAAITVLFPGAGSFVQGAEIRYVGELEGGHTLPAECTPFALEREYYAYETVGVRTLSWTSEDPAGLSGEITVLQTPVEDFAQGRMTAILAGLSTCAEYRVANYDESFTSPRTVTTLAQGSSGAVWSWSGETYDGGMQYGVSLRAAEGNVLVELDTAPGAAPQDFPAAEQLLAEIQEILTAARARLTEVTAGG